MSYTVGQLAAIAHVTVRTLHHYDELGLLSPGGRTDAGYRVYCERDLERLQQILFYRELGFPLEQIASMLDGHADPLDTLQTQKQLLNERITRLQAMVAAVDRAMESHRMGINLTPDERFEVFGDFVPEDHDAEVRERWGDTPAFAESQRRVARYTKDDWTRLKNEASAITADFVNAMREALAPDSQHVMDMAERHRQHITRWFYNCSREMHRGLGEMYVADERFAAQYEKAAPGLAAYLRDAFAANARRADV